MTHVFMRNPLFSSQCPTERPLTAVNTAVRCGKGRLTAVNTAARKTKFRGGLREAKRKRRERVSTVDRVAMVDGEGGGAVGGRVDAER